MKTQKFTVLILLLTILPVIVFLSSCKKDEVETIPLQTVTGNIYETVDYGTKVFLFNFKTDLQTYPITYLIRSESNVDANNINIKLLDIQKDGHDDLNVMKGSASCKINLGHLANGQYNLQIIVGESVSEGLVNVSSDLVTLEFTSSTNLTINHDTLNRIPFGTVWGYVGYQKTSNAYLATDFITTLVALGGEPTELQPGYYGYFSITDSNNLLQPIDENFTYYKEFIKNYTGSADALNEHIGYYNTEHYNKVDVVISWFWDGE